MTLAWLILFAALLAGPTGWLAQNRHLRRTNAELRVENTALRARVEFEQDKTRMWANDHQITKAARRRWTCRGHDSWRVG